MSVFTVVQKRAYLEAVIVQHRYLEASPRDELSDLRNLPASARMEMLQSFDEGTIDRLISAHIHEMSKRITQRCTANESTLQTA